MIETFTGESKESIAEAVGGAYNNLDVWMESRSVDIVITSVVPTANVISTETRFWYFFTLTIMFKEVPV